MNNSGLQSLSEIFENKVFRIPDFQRGYSWGISQLEDFWEDLQHLDLSRTHYMGQLTIQSIGDEIINSYKWRFDKSLLNKNKTQSFAYYVIDGQQRLTTLVILLNEILSTLDDKKEINSQTKNYWVNIFLYCSYGPIKSFLFGYEIDNPSDEFFKTKILEQSSLSADKYPETLYTANLMNAKIFFKGKLSELADSEKEDIFKKVVDCLKFNCYEIDDSLDVYVTFETMNNRGKSLSYLELLKNRLIYLSTLLPGVEDIQKEHLRENINDVWKTIYEYLGKSKEKPLDDDTFLYNHWIMYFTYDRSKSNVYADFLLKEHFTSKNVLSGELSLETILEYIDSLQKSVQQWYYIYNITSSSYSDEVKEWVQKLNRLGMGAFSPLLMAVFIKEQDETLILEFLKVCERFNFLVFAISNRSSNTQNSNLYKKAREYYKDTNRTLPSVILEIKDLTRIWFDLDRFKNYTKELFFKDKNGFYSWKGLRYFLYEYELYLQLKSGGELKITWEYLVKHSKEETIEHIYPQTATDSYWKQKFKWKKNEKNLYLNSLGNLLLLSRSKNSTLQNYDFNKKKNNGEEKGYYNGSYSEIEVSQCKDWNKEEIRNRAKKMLVFMGERWNVDFKGFEERILFPKK